MKEAQRVFVGLEITPRLQEGLDTCKEAMHMYFRQDKAEFLKVVRAGGKDLLGRELDIPLPCSKIDNIQRHIASLVKLIVPHFRLQQDAIGVHLLDLISQVPQQVETVEIVRPTTVPRSTPDYPGGNDF